MTKKSSRTRSRGVIAISEDTFEVQIFPSCTKAADFIMETVDGIGNHNTVSINIRRKSYTKGRAYGYVFLNVKGCTDQEVNALVRTIQASHVLEILVKRFFSAPIMDESTLQTFETFVSNLADFTESKYNEGILKDILEPENGDEESNSEKDD